MLSAFKGLAGVALLLFVAWTLGAAVALSIDYHLHTTGQKTITRWCSEHPVRSFCLFSAALCGPLWLLLHLLSFRS